MWGLRATTRNLMHLNVMSWEIPKQLASVNWILGLFPTSIERCYFEGLSLRCIGARRDLRHVFSCVEVLDARHC